MHNYSNHICKLSPEGQPLKREKQEAADEELKSNRQFQTQASTELSPVAKQSPLLWNQSLVMGHLGLGSDHAG